MAINKLVNMRVGRVILHQIFKREVTEVAVPPFFSSSCAVIDGQYETKIKERIIKSMGSESHSIRMEISNSAEGSVFDTVKNYWEKEKDEGQFIELSKKITQLLVEAQNSRKYPGGVIICVEGTVQALPRPFFCIIKAEMQDGFSLSKESESESLNMSYVNDIFMTKNEKFQKMGLFINNAEKGHPINPEDVDCFVFDSNTDTYASIARSKAEYFYGTFLGMQFRKDSNVMTNNFVLQTKKFIKGIEGINDVKKIELITSLISYIKADGTITINPMDFAKRNFDSPEIIDKYRSYLTDTEIGLESIHKDTSMLGKSIKMRNLVFSNNVKLQIPVDDFEDVVEISKDEQSGETVVTIKGLILNEK